MTELTLQQQRKNRQVMLIVVMLIIGFFCLQMIFWMVAVTLTAGDKSHGVVPEYGESKKVDIDFQKLAQESSLLGWKVSSEVNFPPNREKPAIFTLHLKDSSGCGVEGAEVTVGAFHNSAVLATQRVSLKELDGGRYQVPLKIKKAGKWRFWVKATKDRDTFYADHIKYIRLPKDRK